VSGDSLAESVVAGGVAAMMGPQIAVGMMEFLRFCGFQIPPFDRIAVISQVSDGRENYPWNL